MYLPENSNNLLQAVLEGLADGFLVVTDQQSLVYANASARSICTQLTTPNSQALPVEIQRVCEAMTESSQLYPGHSILIESEVKIGETTYEIQAQWLNFQAAQRPCMALRLQNKVMSIHGIAIAEAGQWGLTPRETEVWLLKRAGYTYKEIAAQLYISFETVRKHLKNARLKRQMALDEEDWQASQAS